MVLFHGVATQIKWGKRFPWSNASLMAGGTDLISESSTYNIGIVDVIPENLAGMYPKHVMASIERLLPRGK